MKLMKKAGSTTALVVAVLVAVLLMVLVTKLFDVSVWQILAVGGLAVIWKAIDSWEDIKREQIKADYGARKKTPPDQ